MPTKCHTTMRRVVTRFSGPTAACLEVQPFWASPFMASLVCWLAWITRPCKPALFLALETMMYLLYSSSCGRGWSECGRGSCSGRGEGRCAVSPGRAGNGPSRGAEQSEESREYCTCPLALVFLKPNSILSPSEEKQSYRLLPLPVIRLVKLSKLKVLVSSLCSPELPFDGTEILNRL
jgi:hypothetical protein